MFFVAATGILQDVNPNSTNKSTGGLNAIFPLIGNLLSLLLFAAGALSIIFVLLGAFQYVTSTGNPQAVAQAKRTLTYAIVGLVIVMLALVIVQFVRGLFT